MKFICCFLLAFLFSGCLPTEKLTVFSGTTMGTTYVVKLAERSGKISKAKIKRGIDKVLAGVNQQMSTYIDDSEISQVNQSKAKVQVKVNEWFWQVLSFSMALAKDTNGFYDPSIGPLVNLWGFGPAKSREVPSESDLKLVKSFVGYDKISLIKNSKGLFVSKKLDRVYIDLSSSAKGFAVDRVSDLLKSMGFSNYLVEVGGELLVSGDKFGETWKVAIEKPVIGKRLKLKALPLRDMSVATSGNYRNFYKSKDRSYSHTIDQKTGKPTEHKLLSASVFHKSCMKADAFATALMAMGPKKAKSFSADKNLAVYLIFEEELTGEHKNFKSPAFLALFPES